MQKQVAVRGAIAHITPMMSVPRPAKPSGAPMPFAEFVAMMALLMALNALAIDSMLPAFPDIGRALNVMVENDRQLIVSIYLLGGGVGALVHGPLSDRYGRRPVLLTGLALYVLLALGCAVSPDFTMLLTLRFCQGMAAAAAFVLSISIIRDRYAGDDMASLMSLISIVFMAVPVIAPTLGQWVMAVSGWRSIFFLLAGMGAAVAVWIFLRLPETLHPQDVMEIKPRRIAANWLNVLRHRQATGYMLSSGIFFGALFGYVSSSQQIFDHVFKASDIFPYVFAITAGAMALSNLVNSQLVHRFGARRMSHAALIAFTLLALAQLLLAESDGHNMVRFLTLMAFSMGMVGFVGANFGAIAMEPFGHIAGSASSFQACVRISSGALIGGLIGHFFDGTTLPLAMGFLICGLLSLALLLWAEKGVLFRRHGPKEEEADTMWPENEGAA